MHTRHEAYNLWKEVEPKIRSYADLRIVGSVRRKKAFVKDVDIVVIPTDLSDFKQSLHENLKIIASGEKRISGKYKNLKIDFFVCNCHTWGANLIWWTGPKGLNIRLAKLAKKKGWKFSNNGLIDSKGNLLEINEGKILERLNMGQLLDPVRRG